MSDRGNLRQRVWDRDLGICQICFRMIAAFKDMTLDHVIPRSKGGRATFINLRATHRGCNRDRGNKDLGMTTDERIALQKRNEP